VQSITLPAAWALAEVRLDSFKVGVGVKLPLGYPGNWNYPLPPAIGRGGPGDLPQPARFEHLQFSVPAPAAGEKPGDITVDIATVELGY